MTSWQTAAGEPHARGLVGYVAHVRPTLSVEVDAPADAAWRELVDLDRWPGWGPTVRAARLGDGTRLLRDGSTGAVQTPLGVWLPFAVTDWRDDGQSRSWSWQVAGVPATSHSVTALGASRCRVEMSVP